MNVIISALKTLAAVAATKPDATVTEPVTAATVTKPDAVTSGRKLPGTKGVGVGWENCPAGMAIRGEQGTPDRQD